MRLWTFIILCSGLALACSGDDPGSDGSSGGSSGSSGSSGTTTPPKAPDGSTCTKNEDCSSLVCKSGACQAPSPTDGIKNGDETDIDCGGASGKKCEVGKGCKAHEDCTTDGCDYAGKCAIARSCTAEAGGATCGEGAVDSPNKKHESCCKTLQVPRPNGAYYLDKYLITAGRMRTFIERTNGNPRAFTQTLPEGGFIGWKRAYDAKVPQSIEEVHYVLGSGGDRRGCDLTDSKARTYWMTDEVNQKELGETKTHPANAQKVLDAKVLNCVPLMLMYALCAWDGARLPTSQEVLYAWQAGENRKFPWGNEANGPTRSSDNIAHDYPPGFAVNWVNIPEPGRYPLGYGKWGHADLVGATYHYTSEINAAVTSYKRVSSGSWEPAHTITPAATDAKIDQAYWAFGGRCTRETAN